MILSVRQASELGRLANRYGPPSLHPLRHGCVGIGIALADSKRASIVLAVARDGRVVALRRLDRSDA